LRFLPRKLEAYATYLSNDPYSMTQRHALTQSDGNLRMMKQKPTTQDSDSPTIGLGWQIAVSILVVLHVLAVLAEPLRFFSQSPVKFASEEARLLRMATGPYVDFMYLSHGYSFFAPNPGPSHLLECELVLISKDATSAEPSSIGRPAFVDANRNVSPQSSWRVFPNRKTDWPRLLYHRHFMLSEFYQTQFAPLSLTEQDKLAPAILETWKQDRQLYEQLQKSIQANLAQAYPDQVATLRRIEHALPSEVQILVERWKLTDPRLYLELSEGDAPATTPESMPKP